MFTCGIQLAGVCNNNANLNWIKAERNIATIEFFQKNTIEISSQLASNEYKNKIYNRFKHIAIN